MSRSFRRLILALIVGITSLAVSYTPVFADNAPSQAITLSPASTEVTTDPGTTAENSLDIINSGNSPFNVKLTVDPYSISDPTYDPHFTQLPGTIDASGWVNLSKTSSTINGNTKLTVPYTVVVPPNTAPGGYYAIIFAETSTDDAKTGVVSHNRVGDILYITVKGDIESSGSISGDALPKFFFAGPIPIGAKVINSGGTHFITTAIYTVTDFNGKQVFTSRFDRYVLPQTEREISVPWTPQVAVGLFTVHRSATINGTTQTLPDEKILVINPWVIIVTAFLIGMLISVPLRHLYHRRRTTHTQKIAKKKTHTR